MVGPMAFKLPESVLVVVHTPALEVLLLERAAIGTETPMTFTGDRVLHEPPGPVSRWG